ncbi:hypothetical protein HJB77_27260 [Rhizobium lentis]|uniref:hypothetical protein n=1 Tax=Rhizobium lentis TaxID=1138194 RepID=UPI001C82DCA7|nr:hypothetical protein [Rhizobium lentis]MBX5179922.1 hypothetical protein [Rhizobium lentis]
MDKAEIKETLRQVLRRELGDCESALRDKDVDRALSELDDATRKLKRLMNSI